MRFYTRQHRHDCGVDLHVKMMYLCILHDSDAFHRLRSLPGIGTVLALTLLDEIHDIPRFDRGQECASYARLVQGTHQSGGKTLGTGGATMSTVQLTWAFSEAAVLFLRHTRDGKRLLARLTKPHGKGKALSILAHKIGRAVSDMLSRGTVFSMEKFLAASRGRERSPSEVRRRPDKEDLRPRHPEG